MEGINEEKLIVLLSDLLKSNGYVDEFIGSWHRYVDSQEEISKSLNNIADAIRLGYEK